jgi:hypothetical protein
MAKLVVLRGTCDAGKTTTSWFVYQQLVALSSTPMNAPCDVFDKSHSQHHIWFGDTHYCMRDAHPIAFNRQGDPCDFKALIEITNAKEELKKIAIISAGDYADLLRNDIAIFEFMGVDVIVICNRIKGQSRTMVYNLLRRFSSLTIAKTFPITRITGTNHTIFVTKWNEATDIVNYIQTI